MSKKPAVNQSKIKAPGYTHVRSTGGVEEFLLKENGLRVLYVARPDTGVVTTNITYLVGAADEQRGETGLAHMLEHMLFKPTTYDLERDITEGSAMRFERETGCVLNANTWKDRTTYFFFYPKKHFETALQIERERMDGVILNESVLTPEQGNVLSEFDMYNGDPYFALAVQMVSAAYHSHPYGHETIGYREDIEDYTSKRLERFYRDYYRPDNAVLMVIGDIDRNTALKGVRNTFRDATNPATPIPRLTVREPKQEGVRRVSIERPSSTNIVSLGFKHRGFPSDEWFKTALMLDVLTSGPESVLHKLLIDSGKAANIETIIEPTREENLGIINITLAPGQSHQDIETFTLDVIRALQSDVVHPLVKKTKMNMLTDELFARTHSLKIAQELTEYIASGQWERYADTPEILKGITTTHILDTLRECFTESQMTIGHFIGNTSA